LPNSSKVHNDIVEILFELCNKNKTKSGKPYYSQVYADHIGEKFKPLILTVNLGKRMKPLAKNYNPDVWAQTRSKKQIDVFEVWHSEMEADAIEDIVYSCLVEDIRYLHIVCTGENFCEDEVDELVTLITHRLHDENGKKLLDKSDSIYIAEVPKELWTDRRKMKKHLKEKLVL